MPQTPKFYLKDLLFNKDKVEKLAGEILVVYKKFDKENFVRECLEKFSGLELKQRINHMAEMLYKYLPPKFEKAVKIIKKALPKELDNNLRDGDFGDFIYASYSEYVAKYGLHKKHVLLSLNTLEEITKRFTAEYAIRHFLNAHKQITLRKMVRWSKSKYYHVRRLASEGSRPRLPWGVKTTLHYKDTEKILDNLFFDKTRYVTRSVANHLNDISKIDKEYVLKKLKQWQKSQKQNSKEMGFIFRHATRTLRKKGKMG